MKLESKTLMQWTYVLEDERVLPPEEQTRWLLRPLTFKEDTRLLDRIGQNVGDGQTAKLALEAGLEGFENLQGPDGEDIEVKTCTRSPLGVKVRTVHESILDLIPSTSRHEIAGAIVEHGRMTEDDEKNS